MKKKEVVVIEPTKTYNDEKKQYNVAAYARVSTGTIEQKESFDNQRLYYEDKIKSNPNYNFIGVFADDAISGTTDKRPDFQRMIKLAEQGCIDIIYTKSISRFSRNVADLHKYCEILKDNNVNLIFEENNIELLNSAGTLMLTILGAVAQMEVENTSAHINWTLQEKMKTGKLVGQPNPLGYNVTNGELVINEEEARTVRYIFDRYLNGMGAHTIAKELEQMGIITKRGNSKWHDSTVMGILKNEKYTGLLIQGKTYTYNTIGHKRKDNNNEANKYCTENNHEQIISLEDWEKVQKITNSRCVSYVDGRKKGTTCNSKQSIFTSKIKCGYCGKSYVRRTVHTGTKYQKNIWNCSTYCKAGKSSCPKCKSVEEDFIKQSVVGMIKNLIESPDSMFYLSDSKINELLKDSDKKKDVIGEQILQCQRNLGTKNNKKSKLLDMFIDEQISEEDFNKRKIVLDKETDVIQQTIDELRSVYDYEEIKKNTSKQIRQMIKEGKAEGFDEKLFELLVDSITIGGNRSDGVDDPTSLHFHLNEYNLNTEMSYKVEDGTRRYYSKYDMSDAIEEARKQEPTDACSLYSEDTCGDGCSFVPTKTE